MSLSITSCPGILTNGGHLKKLEFQEQGETKISLYKIDILNPESIEKVQVVIQQEIKEKNREYKGDIKLLKEDVRKCSYLVKSGKTLELTCAEKIGDIYRSHKDFLGSIRYYNMFVSGKFLSGEINGVTQERICLKLRTCYLELPKKVQYSIQLIRDYYIRLNKEEGIEKQIDAYHGVGIASYYVAEYGATQKAFHYQEAKKYLKKCVQISQDQNCNRHLTCCVSHIRKSEEFLKNSSVNSVFKDPCDLVLAIKNLSES